MKQLTIEDLTANGGYEFKDTKHKKGQARLIVLTKEGRDVIVDDELITTILALGKPVQAPASASGPIKAVS